MLVGVVQAERDLHVRVKTVHVLVGEIRFRLECHAVHARGETCASIEQLGASAICVCQSTLIILILILVYGIGADPWARLSHVPVVSSSCCCCSRWTWMPAAGFPLLVSRTWQVTGDFDI